MIGLGLTISRQLSSLPANQESVKSFIASQTTLLTQYYLHKGKSVWVYYALRRCLAESKPVIWYYCGACYLFVEEGVYRCPPILRYKDSSGPWLTRTHPQKAL